MELKDRIRIAREARGFESQRLLAEEADVPLSLVSLLERGKRTDMHMSTAAKLSRALGCSVDWLVSGSGDGPRGAAA